jgi:hypothetical protein
MHDERKIIAFLQSIDALTMPPEKVQKLLIGNGFLRTDSQEFTLPQVNSLLHSVRQLRKHGESAETCGIDRSKNPCGDASDY